MHHKKTNLDDFLACHGYKPGPGCSKPRLALIPDLIIKITISLIVIGLKNSYFSTSSLAKLLSDSLLSDSLLLDSLLLDTLLLDTLLSDSSIGQSHS